MKLSRETLNHFNCDKCRRWWSIGSAEFSVGDKLFCPWCGMGNVICKIDNEGNVNPLNGVPKAKTVQSENNEHLEQRIVKRWQAWWHDRCFEPKEKHMRELIAIAVEEMESTLIAIASELRQLPEAIAPDDNTPTK